MQLKCEICNKIIEFADARGLCKFMNHIKLHNISAKDYYDTYINTTQCCCKICNNPTKFLSILRGYAPTCSKACSQQYARNHITEESLKNSITNSQKTKLKKYGNKYFSNPEKTKQTKLERYGDKTYANPEKTKQTKLERYGDETYNNREQAKETCLKKYGNEYYTNREKCFETFKQQYGTTNIFTLNDIKEKSKQTKINRYGDEYYLNDEKRVNTCLNKYGVNNVFQLTEVQDKIKTTNLSRYGVEHVFQNDNIKNKIKQTNLTKYGVNNPMQSHDIFVKCHHKYSFDNRRFDSSWELIYYIWLKDHNINFEYQPNITFKYKHNNVEHIYNPDFLVDNTLIELKGLQFFTNQDPTNRMINPFDHSQDDLYEAKHQCMLTNNIKIITDITEYKTYIDNKYTSDFIQLFKTNLPFPYPENDIIKKYHHSIYEAHIKNKPSPIEAWNDKNLVYKTALNRLKYKGRCKPLDIVQGFNVTKIAPKVSVFKRSLAKHLTETYLNEFNEVFDPFSGFSGRMLGVTDCGKRYIGQDINQKHVIESNQIIKDLNLTATVYECDIFNASFTYECLFTCPPYNLKEIWNENEADLSCDEWIDICLNRFKCKKYLFVVDKTEKYKNCIVETIENKSHFSINNEYVILIER